MSSSPKYYPEFAELLDGYLATEERSGNWLAGRLKVSRSTVNRWRSGETRPDSPEIIIRIAEILGVHKQSDQQRLLAAAGYGYQMFKEPEACFTFISVAPPAPPPHFTGRRRILDALTVAINFGENIAIQGMAGIGKTATAQQLAEETKDIFSCGIFWGSLTDHDGNPLPILRAWERACTQDLMDVNDPVVLADRVCELLVKRQEIEGLLLVIVDDVREEWVDAARILKRVRPTDGPMVITTRDERLAMALDMQIHRLDPLPLEDALDMLSTSGTAELVKHETESAKELLDVIGRLPLAIKLAGARLAMLARKPGFQISTLTEQVRSRAHDALDMPGDPGLVATFSITYDTLTADQQRLFRWLSVFATGPLKVPQIAGILGMDEIQTEMALDTLVLLSVLNWGETAGVYVMHPLLRQYVAIHLEEMGEVQEAEKQHLAYFLAFAKANQSQEPDAWDRLETELPNLVLAIKRAASMQDSKALLAFEETLLHNSLFFECPWFLPRSC
ncbi:hypothetical protein KFU94_14170 [Chloroflexi bacterium TSY]|nr:hypothetical protein [Chloroflexi bacterium TSY]